MRETLSNIKKEIDVYRAVLADPRTPRFARWCLAGALGYLLMPFDLIPDWIPIVGAIDDIIIVSTLVILALRIIPPEVVAECRAKAGQTPGPKA